MRSLRVTTLAVLAATAAGAVLAAAPAEARPWYQPRGHFDRTGWTLLGETTVDGRRDTDTITVGRRDGRFKSLMLVVEDGDLELTGFTVVFGNGESQTPEVRQYFKEGSRTRAIDLDGDARFIRTITLSYKNVGRRGPRARVQIYGKEARAPTPAPPPPPAVWNPSGWVLLGEKRVTGRRGSVTISLGRRAARYDRIAVNVTDSDLRILDVDVNYGRGKRGRFPLARDFGAAGRHHDWDLTSATGPIRSVTVKYANRTGGRFARIQVYARINPPAPPPPPPPPPPVVHRPPPPPPQAAPAFDARGWTLLGEQTVDRKVDRDTIRVGRRAGGFRHITLVVLDSDLELLDMVIHFGNGEEARPVVKHVFREGQRSRAIDLPGDARLIKSIDLVYKNLPGGGPARVQVYGR